MKKVLRCLILCGMLLVVAGSNDLALADPCLIVYPGGPCIYRYDPAEYYTVGPGDSLYDPMFDRGGKVLLQVGTNEIVYDVYQAPGLAGFEMSMDGEDGYFFVGTEFDMILDGFSNHPTTLVNIIVVFDRVLPSGCVPRIWVDGELLGQMTYAAGDLVVSTPTPYGNSYSDTKTSHVEWSGCYGVRIWAFSDENGNGRRDGGECFTAFSHDLTIPVEKSTWGAVKELYR